MAQEKDVNAPRGLPALSSSRLRLVPAAETDLDTLQQLWNDPQVRLYLFDDAIVTREKAQSVLDDALALAGRGLGLWLLRMHDAERTLGCIGLLPATSVAEREPRLTGLVEPVVALEPAVWRQGYAVEALTRVIEYAFTTLGLAELAGAADVPNLASRKMLERTGFELLSERDGPRYRLCTYLLTRDRR